MTYTEKQDRWDCLTLCLEFDSQYEKIFTAFERIYIQYERANLLRNEAFEQPPELEQKIQDTLHRINKINWKSYKE